MSTNEVIHGRLLERQNRNIISGGTPRKRDDPYMAQGHRPFRDDEVRRTASYSLGSLIAMMPETKNSMRVFNAGR